MNDRDPVSVSLIAATNRTNLEPDRCQTTAFNFALRDGILAAFAAVSPKPKNSL